ncbi:RHS repeat-associated core domain-containing protein [Desulfosudis oleivorans]|uniref:YD repeat protein n=1 Tax=Desulfosudis oleivorans (strain DSM 6200 / JCM 39069 / Hxd3) TaxID=96561 RepID=A8ZXK4_DESOH|nr:RHS repeat-associated core domain-containing protein [Desulfosudis oleivorans]ABW66962.1 YD repeat protein [Desulfosudis oleivorans Hxd3]
MLKKAVILLCAICILLPAISAQADAVSFLDRTVSINWLHFAKSADLFTADAEAQGVLRITNTTPDKSYWGYVVLNGRTYWLNNNDTFVQPVSLKRFNAFFVSLLGAPGTALHIEILPPKPEITSFTSTPASFAQGSTATLDWTTENADTVSIEPGIGPVDPDGSVTVAPDATTTYTLTAANAYGSVSETATVTVLVPPAITIVEPNGLNDIADEFFTIQWEDEDPDSDATISLYYDTDNTGADGILIALGLSEDPDGADDQFTWDTSAILQRNYYIYAVIDDGATPSSTVYSTGPVTVSHNTPPEINIISVGDYISDQLYEYTDSLSPNGPMYEWFDITTIGHQVCNAPDDNRIELPFEFPFYDGIKTDVLISQNGYLTFGSQDGSIYSDLGIPSPVEPNDTIAPYWSYYDLDTGGGGIYYYYDTVKNCFIVQYTDVAGFPSSSTFQVLLYPNGDILFQYKEAMERFAIIGIENKNGTDGITIPSFAVTSNMAVLFETAKIGTIIEWDDADPDDNALISLFYDTDTTGADGTLIISGLNEDSDGGDDKYVWDASTLTDGIYYVYAVIDDGMNNPVVSYYSDFVTIDNNSPRFLPIPAKTTTEEKNLSFPIQAIDPNGDSLTYAASNIPQGATFDPDTQIFSWTPSLGQTGVCYADFTVTDGFYTNHITITITVQPHVPVVTLTADPQIISSGQSSTLTWTSSYADTCTIQPDIGEVPLNGSITVTPATNTTYQIMADGPGGKRYAYAFVRYAYPSVDMTANPQTIGPGETSILTWTATNAVTCTIEPDIGDVPVNGSISVSPVERTTYEIAATGPGGTAYDYSTVSIYAPTIEIHADPDVIEYGQSSTLTWTSSHADTCTIEPGIGEVPPNGSISVIPEETTTYTVTAVGLGGTSTESVTVTILAPTASITANPETIDYGESVTLTWSTSYAYTISIEPDIGGVSANGSIVITPEENKEYIITAEGHGGITTDSVEIIVKRQPTLYLGVSSPVIPHGESVTLTWDAWPAQKVYFNNGIGEMPPSGVMNLTPDYTATYACTAINNDQTLHHSISVKVLGTPPSPQPEGTFGEQYNDLIPEDASLESYDPKRFLVITGFVEDIDGNPVQNVIIDIIDHPEYGSVRTDDTGRYSIPLDGGALIKLSYTKPAYITSHRRTETPVNDVVVIDTVTLLTRDPAATTISFDGSPDSVTTHTSTETVDPEFGNRSYTMVFTGDNVAYEMDKYGNVIRELTTLTTRATEYTTPASMPAELPPNSAFTYCAELEVDGAQRVVFDKPVTSYVNNFLEFDVGEVVPVGYYDRDRAEWIPADNGVVVKLLDMDTDGVVDALDADGDDLPDDLNENGSTSEEVNGLDNSSHQPGTTYWRFLTRHFTPWDCNWPYGPPADARQSKAGDPVVNTQDGGADSGCGTDVGSHVGDRDKILHNDIPVLGTGMNLHYVSNRVKGYKMVIDVPVTSSFVPDSLKSVLLEFRIAGHVLTRTIDPVPDQKFQFIWDGRDYRGNRVTTTAKGLTRIGFVYDAVYFKSRKKWERAFGQAGPQDFEGNVARQEITIWRERPFRVVPPAVKFSGGIAKGWTLSSHHKLSLTDPGTLHKGDGTILKGFDNLFSTNVAGQYGAINPPTSGGDATTGQLWQPSYVAVDDQGNFYTVAGWLNLLWKVSKEGKIYRIAGRDDPSPYCNEDGCPAIETRIDGWVRTVAVDKSNNVYIVDGYRIRKVDSNGVITTVAGTGVMGNNGDNGLAINAEITPGAMAFDNAGNLYFSSGNYIRKVDPDGIISTVAGNGLEGNGPDGISALATPLNDPESIVVDVKGNLYFSERDHYKVRKIDPSGIITTVAGNGEYGYYEDGEEATRVSIVPGDIDIDEAGNLYIVSRIGRGIHKVNTHGIITTLIVRPYDEHVTSNWQGIDFHWSGIYLVDHGRNYGRVYRINAIPALRNLANLSEGEIPIVDKNGLGYVMYSNGLHKLTADLDTGTVLRSFGYDDENNLISITDQFGNVTTINRYPDGSPYSIVSPDGLTTQLVVDEEDNLTNIILPDGGEYDLGYSLTDLLINKTDPNRKVYQYIYDDQGRITDTYDENGGHWQFDRTVGVDGTVYNRITTGENNVVTYENYTSSTGKFASLITNPAGAETIYVKSGRSVQKGLPCGMDLDFTYDTDPEYKFSYLAEAVETTPSGLARVSRQSVSYQDTDADEIPDLITRSLRANGRTITLKQDALLSVNTLTSPEGRAIISSYDPDTLVTLSTDMAGLYQTAYGYYADGRLESVMTGTRETSFAYDSYGYLTSVTDPRSLTTYFTNDLAGRVTHIARPDGTNLGFEYDANGNMTVLTNPSNVDHLFGYNGVDLNAFYTTPLSGSYSYLYDKDRRLVQKDFPSGQSIYWDYTNPSDAADKSRLWRVITPEGDIDYTYLCGSKVESVSTATEAIAYGYDGKLVTSETLYGTINKTLSYTYNEDFNVESFTYAGATEGYVYDNDGLLTGAGGFTISRYNDPGVNETGLPYNVTDGAFSLGRTFNGYGETGRESSTVAGYDLYEWNVTDRYADGRIKTKTETIGGVPTTIGYTYDEMGRLETVTKDGTLVESYSYDSTPYGTCTYQMNTLRGIAGRVLDYDAEDHLLSAGGTDYQYDLDGFLTSKTSGAETTYYDYSSRGELLSVDLPDGTDITYVHDPLGRRIAKKVDGAITEKYLWSGLTTLLAVYDGADNLLMRFVYADGRMPVAVEKAGVVYYLAYDQVGSLRAVTDGSGNIVKQIDYDSFGFVINDTNPSFSVPFGFAGGLYDKDTGLVRFGYRDYNPNTGRWTAKDPIGFAGGSSDLYGYCLGDGVNLIDPDGLDFIDSMRALHAGASPTSNARDFHYSRNQFNQEVSYEEARQQKWNDNVDARLHQQGQENQDNIKMVSPDGHSEAIFDKNHNPVTDPVNMPTYNFSDPNSNFGIGHFFNDMIPYYLWGNSPEDAQITNMWERMTGTYSGPCP